jgi:hypothetical protein
MHFVMKVTAFYRDNIYTDVFGANLYDRYLSRRNIQGSKRIVNKERNIEELLGFDSSDWDHGAESCSSILVQVSHVSLCFLLVIAEIHCMCSSLRVKFIFVFIFLVVRERIFYC